MHIIYRHQSFHNYLSQYKKINLKNFSVYNTV